MSRRARASAASVGIPFSWENQPGISKAEAAAETKRKTEKLKPQQLASPAAGGKPSSRSPRMVAADGLRLPLPPRMLQQPSPRRSSSGKGLRKEEDPFLAAFLECTRGRRASRGSKGGGVLGSSFSCKSGGGFVENAVTRSAQLLRGGSWVGSHGRTGS